MSNSTWRDESNLSAYIWLFNVGRGISAFIRTPLNQGIMVDLGSSEDFSPAEFVSREILPHLREYDHHALAQLLVSHPHYDHISDIHNVAVDDDLSNPGLVTCPHDKTEAECVDFGRIKNYPEEKGAEALKAYRKLYEERNPPLQTIGYDESRSVPNLTYGLYYIRPPVVGADLYPNDDQNYANALSLVLYFRYGHHSVLFPGDMPPDGTGFLLREEEGTEKRYTQFSKRDFANNPDWPKRNSDQPSLRRMLEAQGLTILVAPHHGLVSGYSEELYEAMPGGKPSLVLVSEKRHSAPNDGQVDARYQSDAGASGLYVDVEGKMEFRRSVTTRSGHHLLIVLGSSGVPDVYARSDPEELLGF